MLAEKKRSLKILNEVTTAVWQKYNAFSKPVKSVPLNPIERLLIGYRCLSRKQLQT